MCWTQTIQSPACMADPAQGDPIHPFQPPWLKVGQALTYHHNGQRMLGHLNLSDNFQWCFTQHDDHGRRVTEIELPNLSVRWKDFLDDGVVCIGHLAAPTGESPATGSGSKHTPTQAQAVQRGTLRSGRHFRGHARHVSAKGLTLPAPQFLWQAMKLLNH